MAISEIVVVGDSVFKGVVFDCARQRYSLLKESAVQLLSAWLPLPLVNRSQMGRTAPEGLKLLMEQPDQSLMGRMVVLEFGGNDCDLDWKAVSDHPELPHAPKTPANVFMAALTDMVEHVRSCGGRPLLSTLPPLNAERYLNWVVAQGGLSRERILQHLGEPGRIYRWQEYYSSMVMRVAQTLGCECLPVREAFLEQVRGEDVMCIDGIHPNAAGHKIIAEAGFRFAQTLIK